MGPPSLPPAPRNDLRKRVRRLETFKLHVTGVLLGMAAALAFAGFNFYAFVDEQIEKLVPPLIQARVEKAVPEALAAELPKQVAGAVERETRRQLEAQRPELKRLIETHVASAIPAAMQLGWMAEQLGGNITTGPGQRIERIDLSGTRVNDADLARLAEQVGIDHVKSLVLRNTSVTAKGLAGLAKWPRLEEVDLVGTAAKEAEARSALPPSIRIKTD